MFFSSVEKVTIDCLDVCIFLNNRRYVLISPDPAVVVGMSSLLTQGKDNSQVLYMRSHFKISWQLEIEKSRLNWKSNPQKQRVIIICDSGIYTHWDPRWCYVFVRCAEIVLVWPMRADWNTYPDIHVHLNLSFIKQTKRNQTYLQCQHVLSSVKMNSCI